jgi:hypothetical protein
MHLLLVLSRFNDFVTFVGYVEEESEEDLAFYSTVSFSYFSCFIYSLEI